MAVLIEGNSVVIRAEALMAKFSGGWDAFQAIVPNQTLCADNDLVRVGFMTPEDVQAFVSKLERGGLVHSQDPESTDIAVADQMRGFTSPCAWAEFGRVSMGGAARQQVAAARLVGSRSVQVVTPPGWRFENSLSNTYGFVPTEHLDKGLKYLRHENGLDVYMNPLTGQEIFVGRTGK